MVWDVWKDGKIVASFLRHEIDNAYRYAVAVNGFVRPQQTIR